MSSAPRNLLTIRQQLPESVRDVDVETLSALDEFMRWCAANEPLLREGRKHGLRIGVSADLKAIIALACEPADARRLNENLADLSS